MDSFIMEKIATIYNDFPSKFGIPRQSGLVLVRSKIVFEEKFRNDSALNGIVGFSHLWLVWYFSANGKSAFSPTVRPPRLGGNQRMGVFATRSPYRPNPIGLSSVKLLGMEKTQSQGTVLWVSGADLMSGTPVLDIKPYLPFTDCHPDAVGGFADDVKDYSLAVEAGGDVLSALPEEDRGLLCEILSNDPRPSYQKGEEGREYGMDYGEWNVRFSVGGGVLKVISIESRKS